MSGHRTKEEILTIGLQVWREQPDRVNAKYVASLVGINHATVHYHFKSSAGMKDAIARHAVEKKDPIVVPMLIVAKHAAVAHLSDNERVAYLSSV